MEGIRIGVVSADMNDSMPELNYPVEYRKVRIGGTNKPWDINALRA